MTAEHPAWLRLFHIKGLGPRTTDRLLQTFKTPQAIWDAPNSILASKLPPALLDAFIQARKDPQHERKVEADLAWLKADPQKHHILVRSDPTYPPLLKEIPNPPTVIYALGNPSFLVQPQIAIVGTRHPSPTGIENTKAFAKALSLSGLTITSGLALGVDRRAHEATLEVGGGTIGVLGTGIDRVYPRAHQALAQAITQQGVLISEFPRETAPLAQHFPQRNRLISGLSWGVLVIEAALQSGSLITAKYAMEQNRDIFAIPGSIHQPLSKGCHRLITQGAKLVESVDDILDEWYARPLIRSQPVIATPPLRSKSPSTHQWILELLGDTPTSLDLLVCKSGHPLESLMPALMELELSEAVSLLPEGYIRWPESC